MSTQLISERALARSRTARMRLVAALGPLTMLGGVAWGFLQPYRLTVLHPHGQGFWWLLVEPPLLVDRRRDRVRAADRARPDRGPGRAMRTDPPRARPLAVRDRVPAARRSACSRARSSASRSGTPARGAPTCGRACSSGSGVLMWPVMVFFTNSTIHMVAHGAWAQTMMLAGAAELGLVRGKLHNRAWRLLPAARPRRSPASRCSSTSRTAGYFSRAAFLHHALGWTVLIGAVFPLLCGPAAGAVVWGAGLRADARHGRRSSSTPTATSRPIFGHLSPLAGEPHR